MIVSSKIKWLHLLQDKENELEIILLEGGIVKQNANSSCCNKLIKDN